MSYQPPPPPHGGYPPQQPQMQQPPAGYPQPPPYSTMPSAGPSAPPMTIIMLVAYGLMVLGGILRGISLFMDPGDGMKNIIALGGLFLGMGLFAAAWCKVTVALKDKDVATGVKIALVIAGVLLVWMGISATGNPFLGMVGRGGPDVDF